MFYQGRKEVIGSTLILLGDRMLGVLLNVIVLAALVKNYGPADFGKWSYVQTAVQMVAPFLALGAEPILMRELVRKPSERAEILAAPPLCCFAQAYLRRFCRLHSLFWSIRAIANCGGLQFL